MKIGIVGYKGRVGQLLVQELESGVWPKLEFAGGTTRTDDPEPLFNKSDAIIDFTTPEATCGHAQLAASTHTPLVIGTTGLTADDEKTLEQAAKDTVIVYAANMSVGVNLLLTLVEQAASRLGPEWDIEISEAHHKHKADAPSGTALALGKAAQTSRGSGDFVFDRSGKRKGGDIGFAVQRGGSVVGEHTVTFYGEGERIELGHKAADRALFAKGALRAALWSQDQNPGLYTMRDVLGL